MLYALKKRRIIISVLVFFIWIYYSNSITLHRERQKKKFYRDNSDSLAHIVFLPQRRGVNNARYSAHFLKGMEHNGKQKVLVQLATSKTPIDEESSFAQWNDLLNHTGWIHLRVGFKESRTAREDAIKTYLAGVLEGYLSCERLLQFYTNLYKLHSQPPYEESQIQALLSVLEQSLRSTKSLVGWNQNDPFTSAVIASEKSSVIKQHILFILLQLYGIADGYNASIRSKLFHGRRLTVIDLLLLSSDGDFSNLNNAISGCNGKNKIKCTRYIILINEDFPQVPALKKFLRRLNLTILKELRNNSEFRRCSAFIHLTTDDLFVGHTTWESYSEMTRLIKYYNFPYHNVPTHTLAMTSYPGVVTSTDDFILSSTGLAILETSIDLNNRDILCNTQHVNLANTPDFMAPLIACRLAKTPEEWSTILDIVKTWPAINGWCCLVVAFPKVNPPFKFTQQDKILYVIETAPGVRITTDKTSFLLEHGYWASVNKASLLEIQNFVGQKSDMNYGRYFIFSNAANHIKSLDDMQHIMQFSANIDLKTQDGESTLLAIAPRFDLYGVVKNLEGATDTKVVNVNLMRNLSFLAISGPSHQSDSPFQWNNVMTSLKDKPHSGLPNLWNFTWQLVTKLQLQPYKSDITPRSNYAWERLLIEQAKDHFLRSKIH